MDVKDYCVNTLNISEEDTEKILEVEAMIPLIAELSDADVFIDCIVDENRARVIAQAGPSISDSVYENNIIGEDAFEDKEPAVFQAFRMNMPVCDTKAETQEGRTVRQNVVPIRGVNGNPVALLIRERDISSDVRQERKYQELKRVYEEGFPDIRSMEPQMNGSERAVREAHHRIKNNLQMVISIMNLQARKCGDNNVRNALSENSGRLLTIATIHDILSKIEILNEVESDELIERLVFNLKSLIPPDKDININLSGDAVLMDSYTATAVSMVITELVTNAIKHAFNGIDKGDISITLYSGSLYNTVTVSDNGVGIVLPSEGLRKGLGLELVEATVKEQLNSRLHMHSDESGTRVSFDFKCLL